VTFVCLLIFGADNFLPPALLIITTVLMFFRNKIQVGEERAK